MQYRAIALLIVVSVAVPAAAQHDHVAIVSAAEGGGELTADFDFDKPIQLFKTFCLATSGQCLYTSINPAFLTPTVNDEVEPGTHRIADGTRISLEIVAIDAALALNVNGNRLNAAGRSTVLGTTPFHTHPSWQLLVPEGETGDYHIAYKLKSESPAYAESAVHSHQVTNVEPTFDSSPTPTPTPPPCPGDCNEDGEVTVDEIVIGVNEALGSSSGACLFMDTNADGEITIDELIAAINMALSGCPAEPTPQPVTFAELQEAVFAPSCLGLGCHNSRDRLNGLVLEGDEAYASLVNATPGNFAAAANGLLRVDPGVPDNSFLWIKLNNPRPEYGSLMPLSAPPLSAAQLRLVRDWILLGAPP